MNNKFLVIAGPCVIESENITRRIAEKLIDELNPFINNNEIDFYFKASFDKANRTSIDSFRGLGMEKGLSILKSIKKDYEVKVVTDIHEPYQASPAAEVCDIIQIPAFLCRQTDLLIAAAKTGKMLNIKKAQFLAPWDMKNVVNKVRESGNSQIMLCERGSSFGYNRLVVDMTSIMEMQKTGCPVIFDATHSVQKPGGNGTSTSGNREYIPYLAKAAVAAGADGLFMETHLNPNEALSDGPNMIPIKNVPELLRQCLAIRKIITCQNNQE